MDWTFGVADEIADSLVGGDVKALRSARDAWNEMAKALEQTEQALTSPIGALQGHNWTADSRDRFIANYWSPLQQVLQTNAAGASAVAGHLEEAAHTIDQVKKGIKEIVGAIAVTILISIAADIASAGLAVFANVAEGAVVAERIAALVATLARILDALSLGFQTFATQSRIGLLVNMTVKLGVKFVMGPQGAFKPSNLLYFQPGEGHGLVVANVLWGAGSVAMEGLQADALIGRPFSIQGRVTLGTMEIGGLSKTLTLQRSTIGAAVINLARGTGLATVNGQSPGEALRYGGESALSAALGFSAAKAIGNAPKVDPGLGNTLKAGINGGADIAVPGYAQARRDLPPKGFQWPREDTRYPTLSRVVPMAPPPGTVPVYTVKPGDNLWNIAAQQYPNHDPQQWTGIYWGTNANGTGKIVNPNLIHPGDQILILPERTSRGQVQGPLPVPPVNGYPPVAHVLPPAPPPAGAHHAAPAGGSGVALSPPGGPGIVEVRPGDTLTAIAQRNHVTLQLLEGANQGRLGNNPNLIHPGEVLVIPPARSAA